jgi:hypothetical protein
LMEPFRILVGELVKNVIANENPEFVFTWKFEVDHDMLPNDPYRATISWTPRQHF